MSPLPTTGRSATSPPRSSAGWAGAEPVCGRFSQGEPSRHVSDYFGAYPDDDLPDGLYNVPPTETIRMVVDRDGARRLAAARWGFQPFWTESVAAGAPR